MSTSGQIVVSSQKVVYLVLYGDWCLNLWSLIVLIQLPWKLQVLVKQSSFIDSRAASHIMHWVKHSSFPVFFAPHHSPSPTLNWYLYALIRSPWDFSYAGKAAPSLSAYSQMRDALTSSYLIHLRDPSLDYLQWTGLSPRLSCSGDSRTGASTPDVSHERWAEGKDHLHQPIGHGLLFPAQDAVGLHCHKGALLGPINLLPTSTLWSISAKVLSLRSHISWHSCLT